MICNPGLLSFEDDFIFERTTRDYDAHLKCLNKKFYKCSIQSFAFDI